MERPAPRLIGFLLACAIPLVALSQVNEEMAAFTNEIEAMRTVVQTERKILVIREMVLTREEAENFWPLYDEYMAERKTVGDRRVKVITDYAASYPNMDEATAKKLLDESVKYREQDLKLKKKYIRKFRKILPEVKVARFFQLDNKLDAAIEYDLAAEIPLME